MSCFYCNTFQMAKIVQEVKEDGKRISSGKKFCSETRKMITGKNEMCEHFTPTSHFWCDKNEQRINIPTCQVKQKRDGCGRRCRQKPIIQEIRKWIGRKNKTIPTKEKEQNLCKGRKILKKRTMPD